MLLEFYLHAGALILGFILTVIVVPGIVQVATHWNLFDKINERKIHLHAVPPFGGIAIFFGMLISSLIFSEMFFQSGLLSILAAATVMLLTGVKDDLLAIGAKEKLVYQVIAAFILIYSPGNLHITYLHHLAGLTEIHNITGIMITLLLVLTLINAYNLIDGIDGLASGLAFTGSLFFGIWFFISGYYAFSILSLALAGSLAGFFLFNVFGIKNKLFMGDTGSLFVGTVMAAQIILFNELNAMPEVSGKIQNSPVISLAVVIVPLTDMLRVMTIRILSGKSPFSADKNHIHHLLLKLFPKHLAVTFILITTTFLFIGVALLLNYSGIHIMIQFSILVVLAVFSSFLPCWIIVSKEKKTAIQQKTILDVYINQPLPKIETPS